MDENDILPCPFCGAAPTIEKTGFHLGGRTIRCEAAHCMGPHTTAACIEDAVVQWNQRGTPAGETKDLITRLRLELSGLAERAEAFRLAMLESGALNHVPQSKYFVSLRRLESAIATVKEAR